jgi:hypothetical protein
MIDALGLRIAGLLGGPPGALLGVNPMSKNEERLSIERERTERLQVILPIDELAAIEEYRYQARMPSRAAAVRELLRRGLALSEND